MCWKECLHSAWKNAPTCGLSQARGSPSLLLNVDPLLLWWRPLLVRTPHRIDGSLARSSETSLNIYLAGGWKESMGCHVTPSDISAFYVVECTWVPDSGLRHIDSYTSGTLITFWSSC